MRKGWNLCEPHSLGGTFKRRPSPRRATSQDCNSTDTLLYLWHGEHEHYTGGEMSEFVVYLQPDEEGGYVISAPEFPGCVTQGETREEALEMIRDAIQGYLESLRAHGDPIPPRLR